MVRSFGSKQAAVLLVSASLTLALPAEAGRKAASPTGKGTRLSGDHLEQTVRCNRNTLHILGSDSRLTVAGSCKTVVIEGSRNTIEIQDADLIDTRGDSNNVLFLNPGDRVVDHGHGNSIAPKWQQ